MNKNIFFSLIVLMALSGCGGGSDDANSSQSLNKDNVNAQQEQPVLPKKENAKPPVKEENSKPKTPKKENPKPNKPSVTPKKETAKPSVKEENSKPKTPKKETPKPNKPSVTPKKETAKPPVQEESSKTKTPKKETAKPPVKEENSKPKTPKKETPKPNKPSVTPKKETPKKDTARKNYTITTVNGRTARVAKDLTNQEEDLIKKLIARASDEITLAYPKTFAHLKGVGLKIGLVDTYNINKINTASVTVSPLTYTYPNSANYGTADLEFMLTVNKASFRTLPQSKQLDIDNLSSVIAHETMHAMMYETLTSGMIGFGVDNERHDLMFPNWFIEGMATIVGGGTNSVDKVLKVAPFIKFREEKKNSDHLIPAPITKNINDSSLTKAYIKNALSIVNIKEHGQLSNSKNRKVELASYGGGYIALAYLGNLIAENGNIPSNSVPNSAKIRLGLDTLMAKIAEGYSLDDAINILTHGRYTSTKNFEETSLDELVAYTWKLIPIIKNGTGSTLNNLGSKKVLNSITMPAKPTLILDTNYTRMMSKYPNWVVTFKGGGRTKTGYAFNGTYPKDVAVPEIKVANPHVTVK